MYVANAGDPRGAVSRMPALVGDAPGRGSSDVHARCALALSMGGRFVFCNCVGRAGGDSSSGGSVSSAVAVVVVVTAALAVL